MAELYLPASCAAFQQRVGSDKISKLSITVHRTTCITDTMFPRMCYMANFLTVLHLPSTWLAVVTAFP